jgi:hypothetical protein
MKKEEVLKENDIPIIASLNKHKEEYSFGKISDQQGLFIVQIVFKNYVYLKHLLKFYIMVCILGFMYLMDQIFQVNMI